METNDLEANPQTNFEPKTTGQLRGMIIIFKGILRDAEKASTDKLTKFYAQAAMYQLRKMRANDEITSNGMWHLLDELREGLKFACGECKTWMIEARKCAIEIVADMPIPFVLVDEPDSDDVPLGGAK